MVASRSSQDQIKTRLRRLEKLRPVDEEVRAATKDLLTGSKRAPTQIRVRAAFSRRADRFIGDVSDRKLPPEIERPPAARMLSPRGIALRLYLVALMEAQCAVRAGRQPVNSRPLRRRAPGNFCWLDLVAAVAESDGKVFLATSTDNRERQLKRAVSRLAAPSIRLVELPGTGRPTGRYEGFSLLYESGEPTGAPIPYTVPLAAEHAFSLPTAFYIQGWIHILTQAEIAAYMMIAAELCIPGAKVAYPDGAHIAATQRLERYGLSKDTYDLLRNLVEYGLLTATVDPGRRQDGTVLEFDPDSPPARNRYMPHAAGFDEPAIDVVTGSLRAHL